MIVSENTHWVLVCGMLSEDPAKTDPSRHLIDLLWCILCLYNKKVSLDNIDILIDAKPSVDTSMITNIKPVQNISDFNQVVKGNQKENLVVIVCGHGSHDGLDGSTPLKPFELVNSIYSRNGLKQAAVVFGQCYSGLYNYTDVRSGVDLCFMGASNLNSSVSGPLDFSLQNGPRFRWCGNVFLYHFMMWILNGCPDVDGDQKSSLMDGYKYAGARTSDKLLELKVSALKDIYKDQRDLDNLTSEDKAKFYNFAKNNKRPKYRRTKFFSKAKKLHIKALNDSIYLNANIKHIIQDPWFLNAHKARGIEFNL